MKAVVAAFNQEKALVGALSVITNLRMELFEALFCTRLVPLEQRGHLLHGDRRGAGGLGTQAGPRQRQGHGQHGGGGRASACIYSVYIYTFASCTLLCVQRVIVVHPIGLKT